jgi:hypothetical protein
LPISAEAADELSQRTTWGTAMIFRLVGIEFAGAVQKIQNQMAQQAEMAAEANEEAA